MDRLEIRTEILENLDDLGITFYTVDDANDSIKDCYNRLAVNTGCITKAIEITGPVGTPYWDLKSLVPDYLYPIGVYNYSSRNWLTPRHPTSMDQYRWDWELWSGQPEFFAPIDFRRIAIVPHSLSSQNFLLLFRASPPVLADDSEFAIVQPLQNIITHYGIADLLEQAKEYSKAQINWEEYMKLLPEVIRSVKNLAEVDKMRVLAPYMPLPLFGNK